MLLSRDEVSIIAQCTPKGTGALALLRLSGINALSVADSLSDLASGKIISQVLSHTIHYGSIIDTDGQPIDEVLFLVMHGPKTFTGQDTVEISCHNNPFIIESIISAAVKAGAQLAQAGEFTKRAVLNKRIDLVQAEAINDLIHANSQFGIKQSLAQLKGSLSSQIQKLEQKLTQAIALSEASFEFLDEENVSFSKQIQAIVESIITDIATIKKSFDQHQQIRNGVRIVLIGSVNAGKSSLFNALLSADRAIVNEQAGTTRDVIEAGIYNNGIYWTLVDTAGLRQTEDRIEQEGIKRSQQEAQRADIILLVIDRSHTMSHEEKKIYLNLYDRYKGKSIVIQNKADLPTQISNILPEHLAISVHNPDSIKQVRCHIEQAIITMFATLNAPHLLNQRQFNLLFGLEQKLIEIIPMLKEPIQFELLSYHLTDALAQLAELTGKTISEKSMDVIFKEFCVGK